MIGMTRSVVIGLSGVLTVSAWILFLAPPTHRIQINGVAQGTELMIDTTLPIWVSKKTVIETVQAQLDQIDATVSTYKADSELSRWNGAVTTNRTRLSLALHRYFLIGDQLHVATFGKWDGTVLGRPIGWSSIKANGLYRTKPAATIQVTFDAVAQGDALELVINALRYRGARRVVIQLGGEVGVWSIHNTPQGVGIAVPNTEYTQIARMIWIRNGYISTSGIEHNQSQLIDPNTGNRVSGNDDSVVVVANTGAAADGAATALRLLPKSNWHTVQRDLGIRDIWIIQSSDHYSRPIRF